VDEGSLHPLDRMALALFCEIQDQWEVRVGMSGATLRLPSTAVRDAVESHGLEWSQCSLLLDRIRILTRATMDRFSEQQKASRSTDLEEEPLN
jgi:hypothetical protein